jgi:hypothetical protein
MAATKLLEDKGTRSLSYHEMALMNVPELQARHQAECEAEDCQREEEDRLFEEEVRRLAEEEENQRREEEVEQRWKEEEEQRRRLEEAEKEYARQKELEKVRSEKRKAVEMKESGEETEKEPEGSNKKVSEIFHSVNLVTSLIFFDPSPDLLPALSITQLKRLRSSAWLGFLSGVSPEMSTMNCLALMPSLASTLGSVLIGS